MKRILAVVAVVLLMAGTASAQFSFGGGGHLGISLAAFPEGLKDYYGMGFGGGLHADGNLAKFLTVRFNVDYHTFGFDDKKFEEEVARANGVNATDLEFTGWRANIIGLTLNGIGKIPTRSMVTPYGLVGLGMHLMSMSDPKMTYQGQDVSPNLGLAKGESQTKFGLNFGAGAEFSFGKAKITFEVKYVMIFTEGKNTNHIPITIGVGL